MKLYSLKWKSSAQDFRNGSTPLRSHSSTSFVHTSTGVDLKLAIDVALVHKGVKHVQDTVHVPDFRVAPQEFNLLLGLLGCLAAVLTEGLELKKRGEKHLNVRG